ncbi:MAG: branched-chain amino acid ABC transporter permease [Rubrivivax sp.]|jgi:branched-chain amino acid transport system permease protein|nr:branched-chain amino acid ABC transporter permease [Rubrivivax sp.]
MQGLSEFVQMVISGTAIGCIYAIVALGFVLIYKASEIVNFAQGDLMMLGAFLGFTFIGIAGMPFLLGLVLAMACMALIGAALDRIVLRPMVGQPVFAIVIITIGIGFVIRSVVIALPGWGSETYSISAPYSGTASALGGVAIGNELLAIIAATLVLILALYLFFRHTRLGIAMQATSQSQLAAYHVGIPVKSILSLTWAISAAMAALVGVLLAPITFVHVNMGFIGLKAFPAAVLGGFGSIPGAIVGGLIIGIVEALAGFYLPEGFKDVAAYVLLLVVLALRPQGLFAQTAAKKV